MATGSDDQERPSQSGPAPTLESTPPAGAAQGEGFSYRARLEHEEHVNDVLRLRRLLSPAVLIWIAFGVLDWIVARHDRSTLLALWVIRAGTLVVYLPFFAFVLSERGLRSKRGFRFCSFVMFIVAAIGISCMCFVRGGIVSRTALGVIPVLITRGIALADHYRRGILTLGAPALVFPSIMLVGNFTSERVHAQFDDPVAFAIFCESMAFVMASAALLIWGGHVVWALRRQVFETGSVGRYKLKYMIGQGGMGEVWAAYHHGLKRDVALKLLSPSGAATKSKVERFEREVEATAKLCHPNTIRVFDFGVTESGLYYYAMELLRGEDLGTYVAGFGGSIQAEQALEFLSQATRAMAEAHRNGIVHRDIKPENLYVATCEGERFIKVLDFGVARLLDAQQNASEWYASTILGTPGYISPEVIEGRVADARSDIYGLGAVLYFMLMGRAPFLGSTAPAVLSSQLHGAVEIPASVEGRRIPASVRAIVRRCLQKEPAMRFGSADQLLDALHDARKMLTSAELAAEVRHG